MTDTSMRYQTIYIYKLNKISVCQQVATLFHLPNSNNNYDFVPFPSFFFFSFLVIIRFFFYFHDSTCTSVPTLFSVWWLGLRLRSGWSWAPNSTLFCYYMVLTFNSLRFCKSTLGFLFLFSMVLCSTIAFFLRLAYLTFCFRLKATGLLFSGVLSKCCVDGHWPVVTMGLK